jgi:hypothetical protein
MSFLSSRWKQCLTLEQISIENAQAMPTALPFDGHKILRVPSDHHNSPVFLSRLELFCT